MQKGATIEQIAMLSNQYNVSVIYDLEQDEKEWDNDAYLIVSNGHCVIALHPENPRS